MSVVSKENLAYFAQQFYARLKGIFVQKETGKGLSTNDYTTADKDKLAGIANGAQANVLEAVKVNGTAQTITDKAVDITVPTAVSQLTNDSGFITLSQVPEGAAASSTTPLMDGVASAGTETAFARGDHRHPSDTSKQDVISDLATIRSGAAAGATAYQKPSTGIPSSDMASAVQDALTAAGTAYQKPSTGIPDTDLSSAVQASLGKADTAVQPGVLGDYATTAAMQTAINTAVASAYIYKGSVANYAALPASGQTTGWVYNVEDTGMNYAWNGSAWDALGMALNIETLQNSEIDTIIDNVFNPQSGS